jgi:hypothetical protein
VLLLFEYLDRYCVRVLDRCLFEAVNGKSHAHWHFVD